MSLIQTLAQGPLDIIGDVHGEVDALGRLLARLGYDDSGHHDQGRQLVFIGDLVDRGPDSPGVVRRVMKLVRGSRGHRCVLGNHEINLLRGASKEGNRGWWHGERDVFQVSSAVVTGQEPRQVEHAFQSTPATDSERAEFTEFFASLPLALEREDLRVVHACWSPGHIEVARGVRPEGDTPAVLALDQLARAAALARCVEGGLFDADEQPTDSLLRGWRALGDGAAEPEAAWKSSSESWPAHLEDLAEFERIQQMENALKVLVSGVERKAGQIFHAGGRWRVMERVAWWDEAAYVSEATPRTIVGHYWNALAPGRPAKPLPEEGDRLSWLGAAGRVFCVDYSAGQGYRARLPGARASSLPMLAALRVPAQGVKDPWDLLLEPVIVGGAAGTARSHRVTPPASRCA